MPGKRLPARIRRALPTGCTHILTTRIDRPDRMALYAPDGLLAATFGYDDTPRGIADKIGGGMLHDMPWPRTYGIVVAAQQEHAHD